MTYDIHEWKVRDGNCVLGQVLNFVIQSEQKKITNISLDGTCYIQTIGEPSRKAIVNMLSSLDEKHFYENAESKGSLINITYRDKQYYGYVLESSDWKIEDPYAWYSMELTLSIEREEDI